MKPIVWIVLGLVVLAVIGIGVYMTTRGEGEAYPELVTGALDDMGFEYGEVSTSGNVVTVADLRREFARETFTADRLRVQGLRPLGAAGAASGAGKFKVAESFQLSGLRFANTTREDSATQPAVTAETVRLNEPRVRDAQEIRAAFEASGPQALFARLMEDTAFASFTVDTIALEGGDAMDSMTLDSVALRDFDEGLLGGFELSAFDAEGDQGGQPTRVSLSSFELSALDFAKAQETALLFAALDRAVGDEEEQAALKAVIQSIPDMMTILGELDLSELSLMVGEEGSEMVNARLASLNQTREEDGDTTLIDQSLEDLSVDVAMPGNQVSLSLDRMAFEGQNLTAIEIVADQISEALFHPTGQLPDPAAYERAALQVYDLIEVSGLDVEGTLPTGGEMSGTLGELRFGADNPSETVSEQFMALDLMVSGLTNLPQPAGSILSQVDQDTIEASLDFEGVLDTEARLLSIDSYEFTMQGLVTNTMALELSDYGMQEELFPTGNPLTGDVDPAADANPLAALQGTPYGEADLNSGRFVLEDNGLLDKVFTLAAMMNPQQFPDAATARSQVVTQIETMAPPFLAGPLSAFVADGGSLVLERPESEPIPLMQVGPAVLQGGGFDAIGASLEHQPE